MRFILVCVMLGMFIPSTISADSVQKVIDAPKKKVSMANALNSARRSGTSWDLEIEIGVRILPEFFGLLGWDIGDLKYKPSHWFYSRVRVGYLVLNEPWYLSVGPTVVVGGLGDYSFGIQGVMTNIYDGYWSSFEVAWSIQRNLKFSLGCGLGIFGFEWTSTLAPAGHAILFKIRLPLGLIYFVKSRF